MGAVYHVKTFDKCGFTSLREQIKDACRQDAFEYGHGGYSGTWAEKLREDVVILQETFNSANEAEEFIEERIDKWGPLLAAKVHKDASKDEWYWYVAGLCSS